MKKASMIYEETRVLTAKYYHLKSDDCLSYISTIRIKDSGKNQVEMILKFDGTPPFAAPMPPK
jgi:hypothetical protein